jgi:hypothetical protein
VKNIRGLVNKSKLLTNNSDFTLQISNIDGTGLKPIASGSNLLTENVLGEPEVLDKLTFNSSGYAETFFSFDIGPGLPKNYSPLGIKIFGRSINMVHNLNFSGPRRDVWNELRPTVDRTKHELGYWSPTPYYKLLSELQDRKIFLEFPAIWEKSSGSVYGAIPTYGNLKSYLRQKRII